MDRTRRAMIAALVALPLAALCEPALARQVVTLRIASDGDELAFKPDRLSSRAGVTIRLLFHHAGEISRDPHDWVLLKPGTEAAFLADADKEQEDNVVVPPNDKDMVLAATPMCPRGRTVSVEFRAPPPGDYPFVCSVPGHGETMHGILTITA